MNTRRVFRSVVSGLALAGLLATLTVTLAYATPPIGTGLTIEFAASSNGVGSVAENFVAIAAGDLDNDGWIDLATGFSSGTNEVRVWENDETPFSGTWSGGTGNAVGDTSSQVNSVAMGDLDHDGNLDLVSGENNLDVIIWRNDGTPFNDAWSTNYNIGDGINDVFGVAVADFDGDGNLDIVSASLSDAGSGYELIVWENPYTALDTNPFDQIWSPHNVADTASLYAVAVADLDRDGKVDIITGDVSNQVRIWSNDGSWGFTPRATLTGDDDIDALAVADANRDGYLDVVSGGPTGGTYEIIAWENDADTPFDWSFTEHGIADISDDVNGLTAADYDNDGYPDLAAVIDTGAQYEVVAWGNDADVFFDWSFTQVNVGAETQHVRCVAAADLDNDGDVDLATGRNSGTDNEVSVWQNDLPHRNAPFDSSGNDVGSGSNVQTVALGDLDGDGDLDIVSGNEATPFQVIVWQNDGSPFSDQWSQNIVGGGIDWVSSVALGDLDGDGDLDIVSGWGGSENYEIVVWENGGTPFSGIWTSTDVGISADTVVSVALGDLDGDGDLDIASGSGNNEDNEVIVWENDGTPFTGTWLSNDVGATGVVVTSVALGDLDGDGDLDIASGSYYNASGCEVMVWENDGTPFSGTWTSNDVASLAANAMSVALGDLDNDGYLDIVSGSWVTAGDEVNVFWNDATPFSGFWTPNAVGDSAANVWSVAVGDLDNDGDLDVISGSWSDEDREVIAWHNYGTPFSDDWLQDDIGASTDHVYAVAMGDLDDDGDLDVVSGGESDEIVTWRNIGGSAGLDVTDESPGEIVDGQEDDVFKVVFAHNGIDSDRSLELSQLNLDVLHENCTTVYTTDDADDIIDDIYVRLDDGDDVFSSTLDSAVATVDTLSLSSGVQTIDFTNDDPNVWVTHATTVSRTYWISVKATEDASSQTPRGFCIEIDPDAGILVEGKTPDFGVSQQDTEPTSTGGTSNNPTAVTLARFEAAQQAGAILVDWETAIEIDNVGFNLYRSTSSSGPYVRLNDALIPSQAPGAVWGAVYTWLDEGVEPGVTYYYKLEDIEVGGVRTFHGPASASVQNPTALSLTSSAAQAGGVLAVLLVAALMAGSVFVFRRRK